VSPFSRAVSVATAWCLAHPKTVVFTTIAIALLGMVSTSQLVLDAIPDLSDVQVIVRTPYPGQAPQNVEEHRRGFAAYSQIVAPEG